VTGLGPGAIALALAPARSALLQRRESDHGRLATRGLRRENVGKDELNERVALLPSPAERVVSVSAGSGPVRSLETLPESAANATRIGSVLPLVVAVRPI
jgi:hypothetical protein